MLVKKNKPDNISNKVGNALLEKDKGELLSKRCGGNIKKRIKKQK